MKHALLVVALGACAGSHADLDDARARWDDQSPANYTFTSKEDCFCDPQSTRAIRIAVVGDAIDHATYADDHAALSPAIFHNLHSIEGLFDTIEDAIDDHQDVSVTYSATGHPTLISIQPPDRASDGGWSVIVSDFVPGMIVSAR